MPDPSDVNIFDAQVLFVLWLGIHYNTFTMLKDSKDVGKHHPSHILLPQILKMESHLTAVQDEGS